jgi:hypothetical protein
MAISENATPESEAKRWFVLAVVGTILYVGAVFMFVLGRDVEPQDSGKHIKFERPAPAAGAHDHDSHSKGGAHDGHAH